MVRDCGRNLASSATTSRPLPSSSRMSTTAKAGGFWRISSRPSATECAVRTSKPRVSMARARRNTKERSSSTRTNERSSGSSSGLNARSSTTAYLLADHYSEPRRQAKPVREIGLLTDARVGGGQQGRGGWRLPARGGAQLALEHWPGPDHRDDGAVVWALTIFQGDGGPRPLQQGLGDKKAKAQPGRLAVPDLPRASARGDVGLAQRIQDVERNAGAIVADRQHHLPRRPAGHDRNALSREIDRILDQVAEPVDHAGFALAQGFQRRLAIDTGVGLGADADLGAGAAVRLGGLLDQLGYIHARVQRVGLGRAARQLG